MDTDVTNELRMARSRRLQKASGHTAYPAGSEQEAEKSTRARRAKGQFEFEHGSLRPKQRTPTSEGPP